MANITRVPKLAYQSDDSRNTRTCLFADKEPETFIVPVKKEKKIYVVNEIDDEALPRFSVAIDEVLTCSRNKKNPLRIIIQSPGGTIATTLGMFDMLREIDTSVPVWTVVQGHAASAALLLSQAGRKRFIYPNSYIQFHSAQLEGLESYFRNSLAHDVRDLSKNAETLSQLTEEFKILNRIMFKIIHHRSGISYKNVAQHCLASKTMTAEEALLSGLFDDIIGKSTRPSSK